MQCIEMLRQELVAPLVLRPSVHPVYNRFFLLPLLLPLLFLEKWYPTLLKKSKSQGAKAKGQRQQGGDLAL